MLTLVGMGRVAVAGLVILTTLLLFFYGKKIKSMPKLAFWWILSFILMGVGIFISLLGTLVFKESF